MFGSSRSRFLLVLFALVAAAALVFAACEGPAGEPGEPGEPGAPGAPGEPGGTPPPAETPPPGVEPIGEVEVLTVWIAPEKEKFEAVAGEWEALTGGTAKHTPTRDLTTILTTRVEAGNPPDVAVLPNPGLMVELVRDGKLQPLDFLDIAGQYSQAWIDLGSVDGTLYGIFYFASTKGTIWYSPKVFAANGYTVPTTWDELIALSDTMLADGFTPWSEAIESGGATGWPCTDFVEQILLNESGGEVFDQWVAHEIPWTDPAIKSAFQKYGQIIGTPGYVLGGSDAIVSTFFVDGTWPPFFDPPQAMMNYLGSFAGGFIADKFPDLVAGEDFAFFPFPSITPEFAGAATGGANVIVAFNDRPETRSFMEYLSTAEAQQVWVELGGFIGTNNQIDIDSYTDPVLKASAEQLSSAPVFRFDADDIMPSAVQAAFWAGCTEFVANPDNMDSILEQIEAVAVEEYGS